MAGYLIGLGFVAFAVWRWRRHTPKADAVKVSGTVLAEVEQQSRTVGRHTRVYAPRVSFRHPETGADTVLEPSEFRNHRYRAGSKIDLMYEPETGKVLLPLERPARDTIVVAAIGVGFIVAQLLAR